MTLWQQIVTIGLCAIATMATRFLPFLVFSENRPTPKWVDFLGKYLPSAVFGMLVVYCLKDVTPLAGNHGIPELLGVLITAGLHLWKKNLFLSIAGGTAVYIVLVNWVM